MKYLALTVIIASLASLTSCSTDPSVYDLKSPCVSGESISNLDQPCQRSIPLENQKMLGIIAAS